MFGRKRGRGDGGYEDNAALHGVGGYEPAGAPPPPPGCWSAPAPDVPRAKPRRIRAAGPSRPPGRRPSRALWILVAVIALGVAATNLFSGRHHTTSNSAPARVPVSYPPPPRVVVPPVVAGWASVASRDGSYAYDVPPNWTPAPSVVHGWDESATPPGLKLSTSAFSGRDYCGTDDRGGAGVTTEDNGDAAAAAQQAAKDLVGSAYEPTAKATYAPPQDATVKLGTTTKPAKIVLADVTQDRTGKCTPGHVTVGALALSAGARSVVLLAYTDDTTAKADLLRLLRSYRGVPAADRSTATAPPTTR